MPGREWDKGRACLATFPASYLGTAGLDLAGLLSVLIRVYHIIVFCESPFFPAIDSGAVRGTGGCPHLRAGFSVEGFSAHGASSTSGWGRGDSRGRWDYGVGLGFDREPHPSPGLRSQVRAGMDSAGAGVPGTCEVGGVGRGGAEALGPRAPGKGMGPR